MSRLKKSQPVLIGEMYSERLIEKSSSSTGTTKMRTPDVVNRITKPMKCEKSVLIILCDS